MGNVSRGNKPRRTGHGRHGISPDVVAVSSSFFRLLHLPGPAIMPLAALPPPVMPSMLLLDDEADPSVRARSVAGLNRGLTVGAVGGVRSAMATFLGGRYP